MTKPSNQPVNKDLRNIPSVHEVLTEIDKVSEVKDILASVKTQAIREILDEQRKKLLDNKQSFTTKENLTVKVLQKLRVLTQPSLTPVINLSGTLLHTNLGRALLPCSIAESLVQSAITTMNLEYDIESGTRGDRDCHISDLLHYLTGAESATVVNNNAAAVLLALNSLANHKEVIVSRGELIEIGGSFRLPEVMKKSGCKIIEVGSTNRTHLSDYENAITPQTGLLLKAHPSNYRIEGFTSEVSLNELAGIGQRHNIPVMMDMGSGALIDYSEWGLPKEMTIRETLEAGADIVTFSGDKLLGGPQAGIIVGKAGLVKKIKRNQLKRAMRPDKLTYSFLESLLRLYLYPNRLKKEIPLLKWLSRPMSEIEEIAQQVMQEFRQSDKYPWKVSIEDSYSEIGSGSLPGSGIPTRVVAFTPKKGSADKIAQVFRNANPPIIGRIFNDRFLLDMRTLYDPAPLFSVLRK
jgi:L-seryl-tRNA(Ser) seleniumtransferase